MHNNSGKPVIHIPKSDADIWMSSAYNQNMIVGYPTFIDRKPKNITHIVRTSLFMEKKKKIYFNDGALSKNVVSNPCIITSVMMFIYSIMIYCS